MQADDASKELNGQRIGYARVSTADQDLRMQRDALERDGCAEIYEETVSGAAKKRPAFNRMMRELRAGDIVTVWKLDRLGRTLRQVLSTIDSIKDAGAHLRILTQQLDTSTPMGKCMLAMIAAFAELERDLAIERTRAGLAAAAERGRRGGARPMYTEDDIARAAREFQAGASYKDIAATIKRRKGNKTITPTQLKRRIDEWNTKQAG